MTDRIRRHARSLLAAGMAGARAFAVWARREDLAAFDWRLEPALVAAAVVLLAVPGLVQGATVLVALRRVGAAAPWGDALRIWSRSWLLRYEPSGAVGFAYRVARRERLGATTPQGLAGSAYEQLGAGGGARPRRGGCPPAPTSSWGRSSAARSPPPPGSRSPGWRRRPSRWSRR